MAQHDPAPPAGLTDREATAPQKSDVLQGVLNTVPVLVAYVDPQQRYTYHNPAFQQWFGTVAANVVGQTLWDVLGESVYAQMKKHVQRALRGERAAYEFFADFKYGPGRWVQVVETPDVGPDREVRGYVSFVTDVTHRKKLEESQKLLLDTAALLESSRNYEHTVAHIARLAVPKLADWCAIHVAQEGGHLQQVALVHSQPAQVALSEEMMRLYPAEPHAPRGLWHVIRTGQPEIYPELDDEMLQAGARDAKHLELLRRLNLKSVILMPLTSRGRTLGVFSLAHAESNRRFTSSDQDLVQELARRCALAIDNAELHRRAQRESQERERAEKALHAQKSLHQAIQETALDCIVTTDHEGRIVEFNPAAERTFGYSRKDAIGRLVSELIIPPELREAHRRGLHRYLELKEGRIQGQRLELTAIRADGTRFPVEVTVTRIPTDGPPIFASFIRDITDRTRAMQELVELNRTLEQRVEERTQLLLHHRNQLRELVSELILSEQRERHRLATELHDYLAQLLVICRMKLAQTGRGVRSAKAATLVAEMDQLLDESLRYTRTLTAELSPAILYEAGLYAAVDWLAQQMEQHGLKVTVRHDAEPLKLPEDRAILLFQSIRELLFNVVKHAKVNRAQVTFTRTAHELTVVVADEGVGFQTPVDEFDPRAFLKYGHFNLKKRLEGIGGRLEVQSAPGRGTRVILTILYDPASAPLPAVAPKPPTESRARRGKPRKVRPKAIRVLLADDHALIREGLRTTIECSADLEVVGEARDGQEAVRLARQLRPDVVVMDVSMPKLNGIEATRRIKQEMPDVSVIALSLHDERVMGQAMKEAGAAAYLAKSGDSEEICYAIRAVHAQPR